ncbi:MAG: diacylglycerol kinase family protein [Bacteroidota bacterium]
MLPTFFILNPHSGRGNNEKLIPLIQSHFTSSKIQFDIHTTTCPDDARKIAIEVRRNYPIVVAGGGDGTVNEVVNGIAGSDCILGVLPLGSGNDFAKVLSYPKRLSDCLQLLARQKVKSIDLGSIEAITNGWEKVHKHFINFVGVGLDAQVAYEAGKIHWPHGLPKYAIAAFKVLFRYQPELSKVTSAEFESEGNHVLISIGNGKSSGGGFYLTPDALLDDGLLDVCMAKNLSTSEVLKIFPYVLKGSHTKFEKVSIKRTNKLLIKSDSNLPVHVDGEILGLNCREIHVEILSRAIRVLVP